MVGGIQTLIAWAKIKRRWNQRVSQSGFQFLKTRQNFRSQAEEVESMGVIELILYWEREDFNPDRFERGSLTLARKKQKSFVTWTEANPG